MAMLMAMLTATFQHTAPAETHCYNCAAPVANVTCDNGAASRRAPKRIVLMLPTMALNSS
eukprot:10125674-Lingulodinium_polyedra.AAC.1